MRRLRIVLASVGLRRPIFWMVSPPLGIMYLGAYLRSKFKADIHLINQKLHNISDDRLVQEIVDFDPDVVGLSAITASAQNLASVTRAIRRELPDVLMVLGGPHVHSYQEDALAGKAVDAAVTGEGELALEAIVRARFEGGSLADVPGIFRVDKSGEIVKNPGSIPMIQDLDSLPFPAYDLIDLPTYWRRKSNSPIPRRKYAALFTSRGCPYQCIYCHKTFGTQLRCHSAERIVDEIEYIQRLYGVKDFEFVDDVFNLNKKRLFAFCDLVNRRNIRTGLAFSNGVRTDLLDQDAIDALVGAGLYFSCFAVESGSPRMQKMIGKNLDIPRYLENVERAVASGVFAHGCAMIGFPGETEQEMQMTVDLTRRSRLHTCSYFSVTVYPNTPLWETAIQLRPDQIAHLAQEDMNFSNMTINLSAVSDERLAYYRRKANRRFYVNPVRALRIIRDFPRPLSLPRYIAHHIPYFINRTTFRLHPQRANPGSKRSEDKGCSPSD